MRSLIRLCSGRLSLLMLSFATDQRIGRERALRRRRCRCWESRCQVRTFQLDTMHTIRCSSLSSLLGKLERAAGHDDRDTGCTDDTMHAQPHTPPKNHSQDHIFDQNHTALRYDTVTTAKRRTPKPNTRRIAPQLPESAVCFVQVCIADIWWWTYRCRPADMAALCVYT